MKRVYVICLMMVLSGCSVPFLSKTEKSVVECSIKNFDDVVNLFPKTTEDIAQRIQVLKKDIVKDVQNILDVVPEKRTFANTAQAMDDLGSRIGQIMAPLGLLREVSPQKDIRDAVYQAILEMQPFLQEEVSKNIKLFEAFKEYYNGNAQKESLTPEQRYYLDESMKSYIREGLLLLSDKLEQVKKLNTELTKLSLEFSKNISDVDTKIPFTQEELTGLPEAILTSLKKDDQNRYLVGMDYPTIFSVFKQVQNTQTRKKVYGAFQNRAYPANYPILQEMMKKRDEVAKLLGFKNYVDYDLDDTMAKSSSVVTTFLDKIKERALKQQNEEFRVLTKELPLSVHLSPDNKIYPWDKAFLDEQYKKKHFNIDDEKLAEYFPVDYVVAEVLSIYQEFLGLHFKEFSCEGLWDSSVRCIQVFDAKQNLLGYLLLDLYPRPNKYSHACMVDVIAPHKVDDQRCPAVIAMIANFPKGNEEYPGLLKFDDVKTFFHEFGHVMHGLLGATHLRSFAGTNVKYDFVETPSQMFEQWLRDPKILKLLSKHYKTDKSLPDDTIAKLIDLDKFNAGNFHLRQIALSLFSLNLFADPQQDIQQLYKSLMTSLTPYIFFDDETHMPASFGHLTGYAAKYYSYLWAKIFAFDLFDYIKKHGLLNAQIGQKLTHDILSKGGSVEPDQLLCNFLGREPNQEAFLRYYGF